MMNHLLFSVDGILCALPLADIRIVIQMVLPGAVPEPRPGLCGKLNFRGQIIPVWSVRTIFGKPDRSPALTDRLILVEKGRNTAALWVDETHVTRQGPVPLAEAERLKIQQPLAPGVDLTTEGVVLFRDLFLFLSQEPLPAIGGADSASWPHVQQKEEG